MKVTCTLHFKGSKRYISILNRNTKNICSCFEINSRFQTEVYMFFQLVMCLKHGLSNQGKNERVKATLTIKQNRTKNCA